jgi:hypothetical protein
MTFTSASVGDGAGFAGGGRRAAQRQQQSVPSVPGLEAFDRTTMDVWTNGGSFPPVAGKRTAGAPIAITGTFLEGSYSRSQLEFGYTHAILANPTVEIRDGYRGNAGGPTIGDYIAIPAGQTNNFWSAVFSFVTILPGYGRRRVVLLDRVGTPGDWTTVV